MAIDKETLAVEIVNGVLKELDKLFRPQMGDRPYVVISNIPEDEKKYLDRLVEKKLIEFELQNKN